MMRMENSLKLLVKIINLR